MNTSEWVLVVFTILAQMSVGSFVILGIAYHFTRRAAGIEAADRLSDRALLAIGPVLILAMLASLLHLGNPLFAPRAVTNLANSWLSREILFGVLFAIVGGVFAIMQWRKVGSFVLRHAIALLAALLGILLVYAMSMVYMLPAQPAWNNLATPVSFFSTTLLLGLFATGTAFVANYRYLRKSDPECAEEQCLLLRKILRWVAAASIILLGISVLLTPLYLAQLGVGGSAGAESVRLVVDQYAAVLALRIALVFAGAGVLAFFLYQSANSGRERIMINLTYAAFVMVLIGEVMGRFLFYASHVRIGI